MIRDWMKHYEKCVEKLNQQHFFVLVEEAHDYVLGTTKFLERAVAWFEEQAPNQSRWFNPAVYVCNYRPRSKGEDSVPNSAVPILSTYHHLRDGISKLRSLYEKKFNVDLSLVEHLSW